MAMSNRDRVDRGLKILAAGLGPFVDAPMSATTPDGRDWVEAGRSEIQPGRVADIAGQRSSYSRDRSRGSCSGCSRRSGGRSRTSCPGPSRASPASCGRPGTSGRTATRSARTTPTGRWTRWNGCCTAVDATDEASRGAQAPPGHAAGRVRDRDTAGGPVG